MDSKQAAEERTAIAGQITERVNPKTGKTTVWLKHEQCYRDVWPVDASELVQQKMAVFPEDAPVPLPIKKQVYAPVPKSAEPNSMQSFSNDEEEEKAKDEAHAADVMSKTSNAPESISNEAFALNISRMRKEALVAYVKEHNLPIDVQGKSVSQLRAAILKKE